MELESKFWAFSQNLKATKKFESITCKGEFNRSKAQRIIGYETNFGQAVSYYS